MERRLGRGLGALLGQEPAAVDVPRATQTLPRSELKPNPWQPRRVFDPQGLEELASSLKTHGFLQPIVVRRAGGAYEVISGERRLRAAKIAGIDEVPVLVRSDVSDRDMLELALVENVQRQDLDAIERAQGFQALMDTLQMTQEQVSVKVGLKRSTVANHLRLLELPDTIQDAIRSGLLSMGHARAMLGVSDRAQCLKLMERAVREGLSVREVERLVRVGAKEPAKAKADQASAGARAPWIKTLEERLQRRFGTKVSVQSSATYRGQVTLQFFGRDDLDRLCEILAPAEEL